MASISIIASDFVKEALDSKTGELNALKYYRQIVFTKQI